MAARPNDVDVAKSMDLIRVVPNPYYGASYFEDSRLDNIVKITNLPERCVISIYGLNGTRIRREKRQHTPIRGGTSRCWCAHIKRVYHSYRRGGIGEKVVKWFGTLRPVDLNAF